MEGLIPFVYRAIMQYKAGGNSPSASYVRLPGDSGRFQSSEIQFFRQDRVFTLSATSTMSPSASQLLLSAAAQSPLSRTASRRLVS